MKNEKTYSLCYCIKLKMVDNVGHKNISHSLLTRLFYPCSGDGREMLTGLWIPCPLLAENNTLGDSSSPVLPLARPLSVSTIDK